MPDDTLRRRYARVYKSLGRADLQRGAPTPSDIELMDLFEPSKDLWMGFYTEEGLHVGLERYDFFDEVRALGYEELEVRTRMDDPEEHLFRLISRLPATDEPLIELVTRRSYLNLTGEVAERFDRSVFSVMSIEWLLLQNPLAEFHPDRPPLPGQNYPGSGLSQNVFELLRNVCRRLNLDALVTIPSYLHNALLYSNGFRFFDPEYQGKMLALDRDIELGLASKKWEDPLLLAAKSWALKLGCVYAFGSNPKKHSPIEWFHEPMISPISDPIKEYLAGEWYAEQVAIQLDISDYEVLVGPLIAALERRGIHPFDAEAIDEWIHEE